MSDVPLKFYEYIGSGIIVCQQCLDNDLLKTETGQYKGDEAVTLDMVERAETPAQCDTCLIQSDDYDDVMDEE